VKRLSGLDSLFVSLESPTNLFHVGAVAVLDPSTAPPGSPPPYEAMRLVLEERLHLLAPFRRRLVTVPGGVDHPLWVEDRPVNLERHLHRGAVCAPGDDGEIARYAADLLSRPLDRSHPLWEMHVVEGLEGGLVAGVAKIHHSAVDGIAGTEVTGQLMDLTPEVGHVEPPGGDEATQAAESAPSVASLLFGALPSAGRRAIPTALTLAHLLVASGRIRGRNRELDTVRPPSPFHSPRTSLSSKVGARRAVGLAQIDRDDVEKVRAATGATVNDVVLAVTGAALRAHLEDAGELPAEPLAAFVPVSVRGAHDVGEKGVNRLSGMLVSLATSVADPIIRLLAVSESARNAKDQDRILGPNVFGTLADLAVPALLRPMGRLARATGLTTRRPPFSVVVSSFPGPPCPLYCAGAELVAYHPFGPVIDGAALNVTAMSYRDRIGFGLLACPDAVSDVDVLARRIPESMRELTKALDTGKADKSGKPRTPRTPANSLPPGVAARPLAKSAMRSSR
jgi:WS/DGAT/MGAT family acyltransferase